MIFRRYGPVPRPRRGGRDGSFLHEHVGRSRPSVPQVFRGFAVGYPEKVAGWFPVIGGVARAVYSFGFPAQRPHTPKHEVVTGDDGTGGLG